MRCVTCSDNLVWTSIDNNRYLHCPKCNRYWKIVSKIDKVAVEVFPFPPEPKLVEKKKGRK